MSLPEAERLEPLSEDAEELIESWTDALDHAQWALETLERLQGKAETLISRGADKPELRAIVDCLPLGWAVEGIAEMQHEAQELLEQRPPARPIIRYECPSCDVEFSVERATNDDFVCEECGGDLAEVCEDDAEPDAIKS